MGRVWMFPHLTSSHVTLSPFYWRIDLSSLMLSSGNGLNECQPSVHRMQETPLQSPPHQDSLVSSVPMAGLPRYPAALSDSI